MSGGDKYITWAEKNGFLSNYNKQITKERVGNYKKREGIPVAFCPECKRAFETRQSNGKKKTINLLLTTYLPAGFPTISCDKIKCGKCISKGE